MRLLNYHSAPRPKTHTNEPVAIHSRVVVAAGIVVVVVWVLVIRIKALR